MGFFLSKCFDKGKNRWAAHGRTPSMAQRGKRARRRKIASRCGSGELPLHGRESLPGPLLMSMPSEGTGLRSGPMEKQRSSPTRGRPASFFESLSFGCRSQLPKRSPASRTKGLLGKKVQRKERKTTLGGEAGAIRGFHALSQIIDDIPPSGRNALPDDRSAQPSSRDTSCCISRLERTCCACSITAFF